MAATQILARLDVRRLLEAAENAAPVEVADVVGRELGELVGAEHVTLLITNFSGSALVRLSHVSGAGSTEARPDEQRESLPLSGSRYEQAMFAQEPEIVREASRWLVLAPITERGDAIGLLETAFGDEPSRSTVEEVAAAAHVLAYLLIASRRHTDLFEWAQRDVAFSLAAEIQRRLLPSAYTLECCHFSLAGWLEPAHEVGGDTFDYSLDRDHLYVSVTDAMGHGVEAALLATLVVGSLRNTRRLGADPAGQADAANAALVGQGRPDQFVTGQVLRIRLADGQVDFVNAGHPAPYLVRGGHAEELEATDPQLPLGIAFSEYENRGSTLRAGDRLVVVTDGFLERNAVRLDLSQLLEASQGRHPREVVRELAGQVLAATAGKLLDDATVLCLDWYGADADRESLNGAAPARATHPD
jgi:serine phosphatase RsbU (regulator of sigma subunit)